jgi:peptidoglycan-associated lipoprotein
MKNFLVAVGVSLVLVGCGTNVPLNDVPVTDAVTKQVGTTSNKQATGSGVAQSNVTTVSVDSTPKPDVSLTMARVVYFDYDSYVIKPEFQALIADQARYVRAQSGRKLAIEGHTDETGGREYNLALGQKRADAVRSALALLGVPQSQMESVSFGKEKPAVAGATEEAYAKNRRTEIRYP